MMKARYMISVAVASLALDGCANIDGRSGFPDFFVSPSGGQPSVIEALNGGIIDPAVSSKLDARDRIRALEAEYRALEGAPGGQIVSWKGLRRGVSGEVYAAQPYEVGSRNCRQYVHKVVQDGVTTTARGTACRSENGSWTPLV